MKCIHCGAQVPENAKFCHDCGEKTQQLAAQASQTVCPACQTTSLAGAKFCRNCSTPLDSKTTSASEESALAPICPYCGSTLKKVPQRKTLCPSCRNPIYVRSRPVDRKKMLVTQEQAGEIEEEWTIEAEANELSDYDRERFEKIREAIKEKYGREVPKKMHSALHDIRWGSYNRDGLECVRKNNFGMFRNTRLSMAQQLEEEGKYKRALEFYLEVCYIDLNGPRNNEGSSPEMLKEFPNFDLRDGDLTPGIINLTNYLIKELSLTESEAKTIFFEHNGRAVSGLRLPLSLDQAWTKLYPEFTF